MKPFIVILGGSFDPIHNSHLQLAEMVSQHIKLAEIHFVPCGNPVHRPPLHASASDRVDMVKLAIAGHDRWHVDTYEVDRKEPSYTIDTLKYFRHRFPNYSIGFLMGMDSFLSIETWGNWQELLNYATLLIVPRKGYDNGDNREWLLHKTHNDGIMMLPEAPEPVSSTEIRRKIAAHEDVSSLLPKAVYDFIKQKNLYRREN